MENDKYIYEQVMELSDVDFTGNTEYFLKNRTGVIELDTYSSSPKHIDNLIKGGLYTRKEKEWYKNIPPHGVLCRINWLGISFVSLVKSSDEDEWVYTENGDRFCLSDTAPLHNEEIKQFLKEIKQFLRVSDV